MSVLCMRVHSHLKPLYLAVKCAPGYTAKGGGFECLDGEFVASECQRQECLPSESAIAHGSVSCMTTAYDGGLSCDVVCDLGYQLAVASVQALCRLAADAKPEDAPRFFLAL